MSVDHGYGVVTLNNEVFNMGSEDVNGIFQYSSYNTVCFPTYIDFNTMYKPIIKMVEYTDACMHRGLRRIYESFPSTYFIWSLKMI